ncbi:MAG TPA: DUF302 domain-containing protein [Verrucomicrobiae bacterium]|nr:DUF302 domain-containing protein [Verrucomicrobiae bacterium]
MKDESVLIHCEHVSARGFEQVVAAFEHAVRVVDRTAFQRMVAGAKDEEEFEKGIRGFEGPSGFIRFLDIDHGAWMTRIGLRTRCKLYILGNPLIARTMLEHDLGAGLNVPVRALIYEDTATGKTRFAYDLPSSLMGRLKNDKITAAAKLLDEKLANVARSVTGADA